MLNPEQIGVLADAVAAKLAGRALPAPQTRSAVLKTGVVDTTVSPVAYSSLDEAVSAAHAAQPRWAGLAMEDRKRIIREIRIHLSRHVEELSRMAVEET